MSVSNVTFRRVFVNECAASGSPRGCVDGCITDAVWEKSCVVVFWQCCAAGSVNAFCTIILECTLRHSSSALSGPVTCFLSLQCCSKVVPNPNTSEASPGLSIL